jgi:hypothetical protein
MKHSSAAWRWGSAEHKADVIASALRCFFKKSTYEPDLRGLASRIATIDDEDFDDDCIVIGSLASFISFEINAATPYVGGGEFMDWAINNIVTPGEPASLEVSIKLTERDCVPLVVCLMQKKCSGL